jgi:hypothetical protein
VVFLERLYYGFVVRPLHRTEGSETPVAFDDLVCLALGTDDHWLIRDIAVLNE